MLPAALNHSAFDIASALGAWLAGLASRLATATRLPVGSGRSGRWAACSCLALRCFRDGAREHDLRLRVFMRLVRVAAFGSD